MNLHNNGQPKTQFLLAAAFAVLAPHLALASETLSLSSAIEKALAQSPDVQQLQEQVDSVSAKKRQALAPSEPTLQIQYNDMLHPFELASTSSNTFQITQSLGFPGRALLNRSQLSDQEDAVGYQLRSMKLQVSLNVKQSYYALGLAQENLRLNNDTRLAYEQIAAVAKRRYEAGQTSQVDYLNSEIALRSNENDLADLQAAERTARAQLNVLLKNPPDAPLSIEPLKMSYHPKIDAAAALSKMTESRNELLAARAQASAAGKAYKLAWMSLLPDFQLVAGTTFYRQPYASPFSAIPGNVTETTPKANVSFPTQTYMAGVQITVPIWFLFNERETIVGASHDRAAAEAALDVVHEQSRALLMSTVEIANALSSKIENFEKHLLPLSEQALSLALVNYSAGKIDFQTLSDTAASRRTLRQSYSNAVVSYLTNYATYGQMIGEDL